jgi:hypothetical protein
MRRRLPSRVVVPPASPRALASRFSSNRFRLASCSLTMLGKSCCDRLNNWTASVVACGSSAMASVVACGLDHAGLLNSGRRCGFGTGVGAPSAAMLYGTMWQKQWSLQGVRAASGVTITAGDERPYRTFVRAVRASSMVTLYYYRCSCSPKSSDFNLECCTGECNVLSQCHETNVLYQNIVIL